MYIKNIYLLSKRQPELPATTPQRIPTDITADTNIQLRLQIIFMFIHCCLIN